MNQNSLVEDQKAVLAVLNAYNQGCATANSAAMKDRFSERGSIFGVDPEGNLTGGPFQDNLFDVLDNDFPKSPEAKAIITRIEVVGIAASARIDTKDLAGNSFTDFFNLLKVAGEWVVLSKVYHTHSG